MLPNLIVIGAAKCGTTSLHEYLDLHPEILMSREKEPALDRTLGPARAQVVRGQAPRALKARFRSATVMPVLEDDLRQELAYELRPEVERLRAETGLPFAGWSL